MCFLNMICLMLQEHYKKPVISVCCWHVHCEECWLHTLVSHQARGSSTTYFKIPEWFSRVVKLTFVQKWSVKIFFYFSTHLASNIHGKFELPNCFRSGRTSDDESVLVFQWVRASSFISILKLCLFGFNGTRAWINRMSAKIAKRYLHQLYVCTTQLWSHVSI